MTEFKEQDQTRHHVISNGKHIGDLIMDVDGFFYFWPETPGCAWPSYLLIEIGNRLNELNAEWSKTIEEEIG